MIPLTPRFLIAAANAFIGFDGAQGGNPASWNAAAVHWWGYWSHYDCRSERSSWPLPEFDEAQELGTFGRDAGLLAISPVEGDIFLQFSRKAGRYRRAGVVAQVCDHRLSHELGWFFDIKTIEGDVDDRGFLGGGGVRLVQRRAMAAQGDRFLRWTELAGVQRLACQPPTILPLGGRFALRRAA